jgi:Cu-processing system permease protein
MASKKILKYVIFDILRSKLVISYTLLLLALTLGLIYAGNNVDKAVISLLNIALILVPLVCIVFGTVHIYNSNKFMEMLLALPIKRSSIFWAEYLGLSVSLSIGFVIGTGIPLEAYGAGITGLYLTAAGVFLTFIFTAFAFLSSVINKDKAKGIGFSLMIWFYLSVIFDGLVLLIYIFFSEYPLEKLVLVLTALNPVDLARIMIMMKLDISALMGYTGATFEHFFGSIIGILFSLFFLLLWTAAPTFLALRVFNKKNF